MWTSSPTGLATFKDAFNVTCGKKLLLELPNIVDHNYPPGNKTLEYTWSCDKQEPICEKYSTLGNASFLL